METYMNDADAQAEYEARLDSLQGEPPEQDPHFDTGEGL